MKLDTQRSGMAAIFKDWQVPLVLELLNGKPMISREAWKFLENHDVRATQKKRGTVSQASVINFLNSLVDQALLTFSLETGKGGHRRIYRMVLTREAFAYKVMGAFVEKLREVFPRESRAFLRGPEN